MSEERCAICEQVDCEHSEEEQHEAARRAQAGLDPLVIASDPAQQRKRAKAAKRGENVETDDLRQLMATPRGRRFMWAMLCRCGIFESSYLKGKGDAIGMAFAEGARNVGLEYFAALLAHCKDAYALMVSENGGTKS